MKLNFKDNPKEILETLLKYHTIETLRGILNKTVRKKEPRANTFFNIAIEVYISRHLEESKLNWAIEKISNEKNIEISTTSNHLSKFRKKIKTEILSSSIHDDVNSFIELLMIEIIGKYTDNYGNFYDWFSTKEYVTAYKEVMNPKEKIKYQPQIQQAKIIIEDDEIPF